MSPTARTSSTKRISGSRCAATANASRICIPVLKCFRGVSRNFSVSAKATISSNFRSISRLVIPRIVPEIGLVIGGESLAERQRRVGVQRVGEQAHHHALVCFGRMAGDGERMFMVVIAVHVGDLQLGFEYGCLEGHGVASVVSKTTKGGWAPRGGDCARVRGE